MCVCEETVLAQEDDEERAAKQEKEGERKGFAIFTTTKARPLIDLDLNPLNSCPLVHMFGSLLLVLPSICFVVFGFSSVTKHWLL